jgi:hypothetical protein
MAINKVVYGDDVLIDLTPTTAEAGDVAEGKTFMSKSGTLTTGTLVGGTSDYENLTNKPSINNVELIGNKTTSDLGIVIPTVPTNLSAFTNDSGYITKEVNNLTNYTKTSSLSTVATSVSYNDLTNKPDLFSGNYNDLSNKPDIPDSLSDLTDDSSHRLVSDTEKTTWNNKSNFSGSYNDLSNKPTIPTQTSQLTNNSGFITSSSLPTKLSDLTDDLGSSPTHTHSQYLTQHQDLSAYATIQYVDDTVGDIETLLGGI